MNESKPTGGAADGDGTSVTMAVSEMMCAEGCAVRVKEILSQQDGVLTAEVDFSNKTAHLSVDEGRFDRQKAIAALTEAGYPSQ